MNFLQVFLTGVGLSMDAMAVAICKGLKMRKLHIGYTLTISFIFGAFQALMPLIGWFIGSQFERYIIKVDHWIAFILLLIIGSKMILEAFDKDEDLSAEDELDYNLKEMILLAIATSIDALAVGITFAFLKVAIIPSILLIGITTFVLSLLGIFIGHRFGMKYKSKAEFIGGIILILIGFKILLEHLGIL